MGRADTDRLSADEIEKMVQDAERFKDEDEKTRKRVDAKNGLENYCFQVKNTLSDEKKQGIDEIVREGLQFLESNTDAEAAEYEAKQKAIEAKFNPIMQKIYQQGAPTGPADNMRGDPGAAHAAPEEVPVDDLD